MISQDKLLAIFLCGNICADLTSPDKAACGLWIDAFLIAIEATIKAAFNWQVNMMGITFSIANVSSGSKSWEEF
ncbi:MAG: hypothetical protein V4634_16895 [Pseudomonadota bacterium]